MAGDETLLEELDRKIAEAQATLDRIKQLTAELATVGYTKTIAIPLKPAILKL